MSCLPRAALCTEWPRPIQERLWVWWHSNLSPCLSRGICSTYHPFALPIQDWSKLSKNKNVSIIVVRKKLFFRPNFHHLQGNLLHQCAIQKFQNIYFEALHLSLSHLFILNKIVLKYRSATSADLEVQLMQLNHCDGVYSNYWNTLFRNLKLSPYINFYV